MARTTHENIVSAATSLCQRVGAESFMVQRGNAANGIAFYVRFTYADRVSDTVTARTATALWEALTARTAGIDMYTRRQRETGR